MKDNHSYNRSLKKYASENRKAGTKAEVRLWTELLRAKKTGYTFLRQRPMGDYILDFYCKELNFAIEVDGVTHHNEKQFDHDTKKDEFLKTNGIVVLRLKDEDVVKNISGGGEWIRMHITDIENKVAD